MNLWSHIWPSLLGMALALPFLWYFLRALQQGRDWPFFVVIIVGIPILATIVIGTFVLAAWKLLEIT